MPITAYEIGISLVGDMSRATGPLADVLKALELVQKATQDTQRALNDMVTSLRGAGRVASSFADAMERAAAASGRFKAPGWTGGGAGAPGGNGGGTVSSGPRAPVIPAPMLMLPAPAGFGGTFAGGPGSGGGALSPAVGGGIPLNFAAPGVPGAAGGAGGIGGAQAMALASKAMFATYVVEQVVGGIVHLIDAAKGLNDQVAALQARGVSMKDANELEGLAFKIASAVPGRDTARILQDAGNLRAVLGENGSDDPLRDVKAALPQVEKTAAAIKAVTGMDTETAMHMLERAVELRGGIVDHDTHQLSPEKFKKELEAAYKLLVAGVMIKPADLLNMMQQAGPMAKMFDNPDDFYRAMFGPMLDMKGSRAGTSLTAAGRQLFGGSMSTRVAHEMERLGLIPEGSTTEAGLGAKLSPGAVQKLSEDMSGGLFKYMTDHVRPAMEQHGIVGNEAQNQELYRLFSTETFRRLAGLYMSNEQQIKRDADLLDRTPGVDAALELAKKGSIGFNMEAASAAIHNFAQAIEQASAPEIISSLDHIGGFFSMLASAAHNSGVGAQGFFGGPATVAAAWMGRAIRSMFGDESGAPGAAPLPGRLNVSTRITGQDGTLRVVVENGRDIADSISRRQADLLNRPSAGPAQPDPRSTPWPR